MGGRYPHPQSKIHFTKQKSTGSIKFFHTLRPCGRDGASEKKQKDYYSGKKKYHTIKTQILLNQKTKEILGITQGEGHIHDFRLFKESMGHAIHRKITLLADSGYQGIQKIHAKSRIPK
ncbi:transposase, partial [Bacillus cereus]